MFECVGETRPQEAQVLDKGGIRLPIQSFDFSP